MAYSSDAFLCHPNGIVFKKDVDFCIAFFILVYQNSSVFIVLLHTKPQNSELIFSIIIIAITVKVNLLYDRYKTVQQDVRDASDPFFHVKKSSILMV